MSDSGPTSVAQAAAAADGGVDIEIVDDGDTLGDLPCFAGGLLGPSLGFPSFDLAMPTDPDVNPDDIKCVRAPRPDEQFWFRCRRCRRSKSSSSSSSAAASATARA